MEKRPATTVRDHFTKFVDSPSHQSCSATFSLDFHGQRLIVKVVESFGLEKGSQPLIVQSSPPGTSLPESVVRGEVDFSCPVFRVISEVNGATQNWSSRAKRLQVAVTVSPDASEYLADCRKGSSFAFERLLSLPTLEATGVLSQCLLVCIAKLTGNSETDSSDAVNDRSVAAILLGDSLAYRNFSPVKELRELLKPLIGR
jgi:hypothetical protein